MNKNEQSKIMPASEALSSLERERLRNMIRIYHGDMTLLELSDQELDRALGFVRERDGESFPTITGLLMVGHEEYIRQYVPSHELLFQVLDAPIALSVLKTERRATMALLSSKIQKSNSDTKAIIEWLTELGMVEGVGNGSARRYMLSSKVYSITNNKAGYTRQRGWDTMQEKELILSHLDRYKRISREGVVELCRCTPNHASWLLRQLVSEGIIVLKGSGRSSHYERL